MSCLRDKTILLVLVMFVSFAGLLQLTYGLVSDEYYNSVYNAQIQRPQEVGRFPLLMPNVRPKTVSLFTKQRVILYNQFIKCENMFLNK